MSKQPLTVFLANPRGFCAGVERAIAIVERALTQYGAPVYVRHEIVHNRFVVERSEEHTSELQSLMRNSYAVFCLKKKQHTNLVLLVKLHFTNHFLIQKL